MGFPRDPKGARRGTSAEPFLSSLAPSGALGDLLCQFEFTNRLLDELSSENHTLWPPMKTVFVGLFVLLVIILEPSFSFQLESVGLHVWHVTRI